ncbi:ABC transporter permease [Luteimicrobium subarcticum]|uniref:Peptide/nickel transport system permease protein n=1 Tax=Luteimicrobium subarcticum TaxID=620910 RepID=A0A2M8WUM9_9MICO|nr:ABC transporter permease [Luteimicrobium subarcticum]PJI94640.1 peptide/nickel transport system permease protein [Luteimicrobium subarcticum]
MSTPTNPQNPENLPDEAFSEHAENEIELKDVAGLSQSQIVRRRFFRHKGAMAGLVALIAVIVLAITSVGLGPIPGWWKWDGSPGDVERPGGAPTMTMPSWLGGAGFHIGDHPLGQDEIGRDVFANVMKGTQTSLMVMFAIGIVSCLLGVLIGALSGFFRGRTDTALMRFTDLVITVPTIVIGAVIGKMTGHLDPWIFAVALGAVLWTSLARLVRGEFLSLREREFVDAARVAGASNTRIIFKHILPNAIGVIIVSTTLLMSSAVLLETALSYLGFGVQSPDVSLGLLISNYQSSFNTRPWLFWWPGVFIVILALTVNFIGDGLRDAFDPRQKRIPSVRKMEKAKRAQRAVPTPSTSPGTSPAGGTGPA